MVVYSVKAAEEAKKFFDLGPFKPTVIVYFEVVEKWIKFFKTQVIKAGESVDLIQLSVKNKKNLHGERMLDSYLTLDTNLTSIKIPLLAFDGKLQLVKIPFMFLIFHA